MNEPATSSALGLRVILWTARIMATLIVLFSVTMIIAYVADPFEAPPESFEVSLLALFPIGMCIGYLLAWKWPLAGGVASISCIVTFLILLGEADMITTLAFIGIPGLLFIAYGILRRRIGAAPSGE